MQFIVDSITITVAHFENQFFILPTAADALHAEFFASCHQLFGEETRHVANATYNSATENIFLIAHCQGFIRHSIVNEFTHRVHMQGDAFLTHTDFPLIAFLCVEIIKHGKSLQILVPPIQHIIHFVHIFSRHFGVLALIIQGVGSDNDGHFLVVDGRVSSTFQMLVCNAAVFVLDFVVPFRV